MAEQKPNFMVQHLMNLEGTANWPDANVARTALVTKPIAELHPVPHERVRGGLR